MTPSKARGRPKGTGLNDAAQLRAIAGLMAADPALKPTTAIRTLGITDPSVIRRLRDKFSAAEQELIAELAPQLPFGEPTATPITLPEKQAAAPAVLPPKVIEAPAPAAAPAKTPAFVPEPKPERPARPQHVALPSQTELPSWIGVSVSVYALTFEAQCVAIGTMFEWPPLAAVLRTQVTLTEAAVAMTRPVFGLPSKG